MQLTYIVMEIRCNKDLKFCAKWLNYNTLANVPFRESGNQLIGVIFVKLKKVIFMY
jgi:hypothetical protein